MKMVFNFKEFRTAAHLRSAMITHCKAVARGEGLRGNCPRDSCTVRRRGTLRTSRNCRVAFCPQCDRVFDAIEIVRIARQCSHFEACSELASVIVTA